MLRIIRAYFKRRRHMAELKHKIKHYRDQAIFYHYWADSFLSPILEQRAHKDAVRYKLAADRLQHELDGLRGAV